MNIDKYLYEIIDDYKNANSEEEKAEIFKDFCSSIWGCKNKRRTYIKSIKFKVKNDLLKTEVGQIFNAWSHIDYIGYKSMTKDTDWCNLIRQKINNLYTRYFDKDVILKKDYMDLLKTPYNLYYRWIKGINIDTDNLTDIIVDAVHKAEDLKTVYQKQKMDKSWAEYKIKIEDFLLKTLNNCVLIEDYEKKGLTNKYIYELSVEDNFYIKYICDSLEGLMLNYQKEDAGLYVPSSTKQHKRYKNCKECGKLIEKSGKNTQYCRECRDKKRKETKRNWWNNNH